MGGKRKASELPEFTIVVIRADARYFCKMGYEPAETLKRVEEWLNDGDDKEIEAKVIRWLESDRVWRNEIWRGTARHFWYFWPIVWFVSHHVPTGWLKGMLKRTE